MMELYEDMSTINDVRQTLEKKAVEILKRVEIDQYDKEKYFVIGTSLSKIEKNY